MDNLSRTQRAFTMSRIGATDSKAELVVRRVIRGLGLRYRLHDKSLPGRPDIVMSSRRKIVLVNGCFWHRHRCKRGRPLPKTNTWYWASKLQGNAERDRRNRRRLRQCGWDVFVIWECWTHDPKKVEAKLREFLKH